MWADYLNWLIFRICNKSPILEYFFVKEYVIMVTKSELFEFQSQRGRGLN